MLTAVELFSGAGGLILGLQNAGFKTVFACEVNKRFCQTHTANFPNIPVFEDDIRNLSKEYIDEFIKGQEIDIVIGGPPCQGFSVFGKRRFVHTKGYNPKEDSRNHLVYEYIRVVDEIKPKFFFMENVKGFLSMDNGKFIQEVKQKFEEIGYKNIWYGIVCAADYGVPQERYRMFMIGNRIGVNFVPPTPTHFSRDSILEPKYLTVGESIMDLAEDNVDISNHVPLYHKPLVAERMSYVKEGGKLNLAELPEHLAVATRSDSKTGKVDNYSHIYKRLDRKKPSWTLVPGHNAFPIHPTLNRTLTVREAARLQSFPDTHVFCGTRQEQCIQVGNAVPPLLAEVFLKSIADHLKSIE